MGVSRCLYRPRLFHRFMNENVSGYFHYLFTVFILYLLCDNCVHLIVCINSYFVAG